MKQSYDTSFFLITSKFYSLLIIRILQVTFAKNKPLKIFLGLFLNRNYDSKKYLS